MPQVFAQIAKWRALGLGDIHALMQAMAIDPAMLDYLDNAGNVKAAPNENFARELMELFTMGNGTFTEADVIAMARAWTGHNLSTRHRDLHLPPRQARHRAEDAVRHHQELGRSRAPSPRSSVGRSSPSRARYLAGRIWSFFAYPNPAAELLDDLAAAFIDVDMDVKAFLQGGVPAARVPARHHAGRASCAARSSGRWRSCRATGLRHRRPPARALPAAPRPGPLQAAQRVGLAPEPGVDLQLGHVGEGPRRRHGAHGEAPDGRHIRRPRTP